MGFGLNYESTGGGDIVPIIKYDARAGRMFRIDRVNGVNEPEDITKTFKAVVDLENVEVGFMDFPTGSAPIFVLVPLGDPMPSHPGGNAKQGVRIMLKLSKDCGGDVRELATSAKAAMRGLDELHTAFVEGQKKHAGKLPVVAMKDTIAISSEGQGKKTTNYQPVFEIVSWVARPADLVHKPKARSTQTAPASSGPPATGSTKVEAPAKREMADAEDFG